MYIVLIRHGAPLSDGPKITNSTESLIYVAKSYLLIPQKASPFLGVAWTLGYEVLFYLVFAVCIKLKFKWANAVCLLWITLLFIKYAFFKSVTNTFLNFVLNPIIIEFLIGCLVAYLFTLKKNYLSLSLFLGLTVLLSLGCFIVSQYLHHSISREHIEWIMLFGLAAGLLVWGAAVVDNNSIFASHIPKPKVMLLLGNASYSIYLIHDMFLRNYAKAIHLVLMKVFNNHTTLILYFDYVSFITLTLITSFFFYQWVERPLTKFINSKLA